MHGVFMDLAALVNSINTCMVVIGTQGLACLAVLASSRLHNTGNKCRNAR